MIDSSVLVAALTNDEARGEEARDLVVREPLVAPELIDVEVISALRRLVRTGVLDTARAGQAVEDLPFSPVTRAPHKDLVARAWELRDNLSAYDACYVALAEAMETSLLTADKRLASAPGIRCEIELIA